MARYEHLPIYKQAPSVAVHFEWAVSGALTGPVREASFLDAKLMRSAPMPTLQIRDLPEDVYQGVVAAARAEHRSLSQQAVVELRRALGLTGAVQRTAQVLAGLRESGRRLTAEVPMPEALVREDRDRR